MEKSMKFAAEQVHAVGQNPLLSIRVSTGLKGRLKEEIIIATDWGINAFTNDGLNLLGTFSWFDICSYKLIDKSLSISFGNEILLYESPDIPKLVSLIKEKLQCLLLPKQLALIGSGLMSKPTIHSALFRAKMLTNDIYLDILSISLHGKRNIHCNTANMSKYFEVIPLLRQIKSIQVDMLSATQSYIDLYKYLSNDSIIEHVHLNGEIPITFGEFVSAFNVNGKSKIEALSFTNSNFTKRQISLLISVINSKSIRSLSFHNAFSAKPHLFYNNLLPMIRKKIKHLNLSGTKGLLIPHILNPRLVSLGLDKCGIEITALLKVISDQRKNLKCLSQLSISGNPLTKPLRHIELPTSLHTIFCDDVTFKGDLLYDFLKFCFSKFQNGLKLSVRNAKVESEDKWMLIERLFMETSFTSLLAFAWNYNSISTSMFKFLSRQTQLSLLDISDCFKNERTSVFDSFLEYLSSASSLDTLIVNHCLHASDIMRTITCIGGIPYVSLLDSKCGETMIDQLKLFVSTPGRTKRVDFDGAHPESPNCLFELADNYKARNAFQLVPPFKDIERFSIDKETKEKLIDGFFTEKIEKMDDFKFLEYASTMDIESIVKQPMAYPDMNRISVRDSENLDAVSHNKNLNQTPQNSTQKVAEEKHHTSTNRRRSELISPNDVNISKLKGRVSKHRSLDLSDEIELPPKQFTGLKVLIPTVTKDGKDPQFIPAIIDPKDIVWSTEQIQSIQEESPRRAKREAPEIIIRKKRSSSLDNKDDTVVPKKKRRKHRTLEGIEATDVRINKNEEPQTIDPQISTKTKKRRSHRNTNGIPGSDSKVHHQRSHSFTMDNNQHHRKVRSLTKADEENLNVSNKDESLRKIHHRRAKSLTMDDSNDGEIKHYRHHHKTRSLTMDNNEQEIPRKRKRIHRSGSLTREEPEPKQEKISRRAESAKKRSEKQPSEAPKGKGVVVSARRAVRSMALGDQPILSFVVPAAAPQAEVPKASVKKRVKTPKVKEVNTQMIETPSNGLGRNGRANATPSQDLRGSEPDFDFEKSTSEKVPRRRESGSSERRRAPIAAKIAEKVDFTLSPERDAEKNEEPRKKKRRSESAKKAVEKTPTDDIIKKKKRRNPEMNTFDGSATVPNAKTRTKIKHRIRSPPKTIDENVSKKRKHRSTSERRPKPTPIQAAVLEDVEAFPSFPEMHQPVPQAEWDSLERQFELGALIVDLDVEHPQSNGKAKMKKNRAI